MLYLARDDQGAGTRAHIYSMHAHVCQLAPAAAAHLHRPPPSRELHSFAAAAAIPGAVHRCPQAHNFQPPPRRCRVSCTSPGTTNPRLLPPLLEVHTFTACRGRILAATHRHEVLRQAGSARLPTVAPEMLHGMPPLVSGPPTRCSWASSREVTCSAAT